MRQKSSGWKKCVDETKRQNEFVDEFRSENVESMTKDRNVEKLKRHPEVESLAIQLYKSISNSKTPLQIAA